MPNRSRYEDELREIRSELNALRAEYEMYRKQTMASHSSESGDFLTQFHDAITDHLRQRYAFLRIEKRISALEKRIAELESVSPNALN